MKATILNGETEGALRELVEEFRESDWRVVDAVAAAIVELRYDGTFMPRIDEIPALKAAIRATPVPTSVGALVGAAFDDERLHKSDPHPSELVPLMVIHQCANDFREKLPSILNEAIPLARSPDLRWSVRGDVPPMMQTSTDGSAPRARKLSAEAQRAMDESRNALRRDRANKDPALNGIPEEALIPPKEHLKDEFHWWCLKLGFMIASPHADQTNYVKVIDAIGDHCLRLMPDARRKAREKATRDQKVMHDRYGTEENESLPRYARSLVKRGEYARAALLCQMAIEHGIQPKSAGAFERVLGAAQKKLGMAKRST